MAQWDIKDKIFLVTGGASGIGGLCVESFLKQGAKKVAILDVNEKVGAAATERLNKTYGDKTVFIKCDVSKEDEITSAFDAVLAQFKQIDVIVNNAGIMVDSPEMWRAASDVNWQGVVSFTMKGIKHMRKDEGGAGGTIVNISSLLAILQFPFLPIYTGSKMAVLQFSQCLAMGSFYENTGIRILTMCYGATDTPLLQNLESRAYCPILGKMMLDSTILEDGSRPFQKIESAVAGFDYMLKNGACGSIWTAVDDKPAKDITAMINKAFKDFEAAIFS